MNPSEHPPGTETVRLPHGLHALLILYEEPLSIPLPFHISPRRAAHYTDRLPDDDPGPDLFTGPAPQDYV